MSKDTPTPLGVVTVLVGRAFYLKMKDGSSRSDMLLAVMHGETETPDGGKVSFSAAGATIRYAFSYTGDTEEQRAQQTYDISVNDLADALHKLNLKRRAAAFAGEPLAEET